MVIGLLVPVVLVALVVVVLRTARARGGGEPADGRTVRRFFQYLLLYGLFVVVAVGLAGLFGRLLDGEGLVRADQVELARDLAFTVVGVPLFAGVAVWSRRRLAEDASEARSLGWAFSVTAASLTALVMTMIGLEEVLSWAVGLAPYEGAAPARALVWGGAWAALWWVDARVTPPEHARVHHVAGSLLGVVTAATGLVGLLAGSLRTLLGLDVGAVLTVGGNPILQGVVVVAVGAPVWVVHWARTESRHGRDPLRLAYVLLAGVAGGLVTAVLAASTLVWSVLVWLLGDPASAVAAEHFDGAPTEAAAAAVGALVWWYHRAVLRATGAGPRTEVRRVYEYLMAAIGLLAAAGGLVALVSALVEAVTGTALVGGSTVNTLLAALTLLAVGGPVWWLYWRGIQAAARDGAAEEIASPTRRVYLAVLFGVGGVAAVVALVVAVYLLLQDVVEGRTDAETLRRMRVALGVLLAAPAVAGYHWTIHRADRERAPEAVGTRGPTFLLLVGPPDRRIAREVARRTHGRVQAWSRTTDHGGRTWSADEVMAVLGETEAEEVIVLSDADGLHAIPVHRG